MNACGSLTTLASAVVVAVAPFLVGCEPTTGQQGGSSSSGGLVACDPNGFGPLSGCRDTDSTERAAEPVSSTDDCDPSGFGPLSGCDDSATEQDTPDGDDSQGLAPDEGVSQGDLEETAEHEAGHKAVADEYGWSIMSARIRPDGSGAVYVWGLRWKDPQQQLAFYYAGAIACGDESSGYGSATTKGDFDYAEEILDRYPPDEANRLEAAARTDAKQIVNSRAAQIDRDAADLLEDGELG